MLKYGKNITFNPDKFDPLNIDRQSIELIPQGSTLLDIGCATGFMGEYLIKKKDCQVYGIEISREEAREARKRLVKVFEGDVENKSTLNQIKEKFDVILAQAIIEHLKDPLKALKSWRRFLKKGGVLIVTTSNITHWSTRLDIIRGKFDYKDYGILDNTHLRFYTMNTFPELVRSAGYKIEKFSIDPVGGGLPRISKYLSNFFPNVFAYQMLVMAKPKWM